METILIGWIKKSKNLKIIVSGDYQQHPLDFKANGETPDLAHDVLSLPKGG